MRNSCGSSRGRCPRAASSSCSIASSGFRCGNGSPSTRWPCSFPARRSSFSGCGASDRASAPSPSTCRPPGGGCSTTCARAGASTGTTGAATGSTEAAREACLARLARAHPGFASLPPGERAAQLAAYAGITEAEAARLLAPGTGAARRGVHRAHARAAAGARAAGPRRELTVRTVGSTASTGENEWNRRNPRPSRSSRRSKIVAAMRAEIGKAVVGQAEVVDQVIAALLAAGHVLVEGRAGPGQDAARARARQDLRRHLFAHPVHARSHAGGRHRPHALRPGGARVRHAARPGVREPAPRRRDQPRARQDAGGAARGDAGGTGDDRGHAAKRWRPRSWSSPRRTR